MLRFIYILLAFQMAFNAFSNVIEQRNNTYFLPKILSDKDLELYTSTTSQRLVQGTATVAGEVTR